MPVVEASRVLIVTDQKPLLAWLQSTFEQLGVEWYHAEHLRAVRTSLGSISPDVVFLDAQLIDMETLPDGPDAVREGLPEPTILAVVVNDCRTSTADFLAAGADLVLREPVTVADVHRALVRTAALHPIPDSLRRRRLRRMNALRQLTLDAFDTVDGGDSLARMLETGRRALGATALAIWHVAPDSDRFQCLAQAKLPHDYQAHFEERSTGTARTILDRMLQERHETLSLSGADVTPVQLTDPVVAAKAGFGFVYALPIRDAGTFHGMLAIYFGSIEEYDPADLPLGDAFAASLAAALSTIKLRSEMMITEQLYRELVGRLPIGMVVCDVEGTITLVNSAMSELTGRDVSALIGTSLADLFVHPESIPWDEWRTAAIQPSPPVVLHLHWPAGRRLTTTCRARVLELPTREGHDRATHLQITIEDITVSHRRLHELQLLHDLSRLIATGGAKDDVFQLVAQRLVTDLGYRLVEVSVLTPEGDELELRAYAGSSQREPQRWSIDRGITGRAIRENRSQLIRNVHEDPDYIEVDPAITAEVAAVIRSAGRPVGLLSIGNDVTHPLTGDDLALAESIAVHLGLLLDQVAFTEHLAMQARTDPLLGIPNRRMLIERLQSLAKDRRVSTAAVFLMDLDKFKQVNDEHGHLVGDAILEQVARRLSSSLRPGDLLARYAGDEFAVVLLNVDLDTSHEVADRLCQTIADQPFRYEDIEIPLTVSIGIALFPSHGTTTDDLLALADRAMYVAKLHGGNAAHSALVAL